MISHMEGVSQVLIYYPVQDVEEAETTRALSSLDLSLGEPIQHGIHTCATSSANVVGPDCVSRQP